MWTGDSLTVIEWLGAAVIASIIGAICAPTPTRANIVWGFAAFFFILLVGWIVAPTATGIFATIRPLVAGLVKSNAVATVVIIGIVGMMVGKRQALQAPKAQAEMPQQMPKFAVPTTTKWKPDIALRQGIGYLGARSTWSYPYGPNTIENTKEALLAALDANKITAWGREHPGEGELFEIKQLFWAHAEVTLDTDYAFSKRLGVGAYDIQLCLKEMEQIWPPKTEN